MLGPVEMKALQDYFLSKINLLFFFSEVGEGIRAQILLAYLLEGRTELGLLSKMLGLVRKDSTSLGFIRGGGMTGSAEREEMAIAVWSS